MRTHEEIAAIAPGASAIKSAKKLAKPEQWRRLGREGEALWGVALGSKGDTYAVYLADVFLSEGRAEGLRCSCPSRKRPCKHALALAMIAADGYEFQDEELPKAHRFSS